jgi:ABC-type branched-subunit amino acid transport system substrate-binding protein
MFIRRRKLALTVAAGAAALVAVTACGSSGGSNASNGSGGSGGSSTAGASPKKTITIGILSDLTGPAASGNKTMVTGVKAGTFLAAREGYQIKYVSADTATSPTGALSAAQKLVTQDHVLAVLAESAVAFGAAPYLTAHNVPVIGPAQDASEWTTSRNMFATFGAVHSTMVASQAGEFFKMMGVTKLASLGYSISPSSSESAKASAASAQAAGVKVGYLNAQFPFGGTNVGPEVLAMKKAGIDGFTAATDPNTAFALITGLRQQGVDVRAALLATGYGGDLTQAGPGAINAAQNVYFSLSFEPIELGTPATKRFASDLRSAGVTADPTYAEYNGYVAVGLLLRGLRGAGTNPTRATLLTALSGIHDFDAVGLFGSHTLDVNDRTNLVGGADNCMWVARLQGSSFVTVRGADPICGHVLTGVTVSPSS